MWNTKKLTINNLEKLKYHKIDTYEVREVDSPTTYPIGTTYKIHAFNPKVMFTSLFIIIYRDIMKDGYVKVKLNLVGVIDAEKNREIPLSKFADMNGWVREIEEQMNIGKWERPSLKWT
jgi:hypothetical protein